MSTAARSSSTVSPLPQMLQVDEVARVLGTSEWMVRQHIRRGDLRAARLTGGKRAPYRVSESDIASFIEARTTGGRS